MATKGDQLVEAARDGRLADVTRFVEHEGVDPNYENGRALWWAAGHKRTDVVAYLLTKKIHTECRSVNGDTALHIAAYCKYVEIARLLLEANADINAKNKFNRTPLDVAVEEGHGEIAQLLRGHVRKRDEAALLAALHDNRFADAKSLLKNIDVNLCDSRGMPLLHLVATTGNMDLLETLLATRHLNVDATDTAGRTALARVAATGNGRVAQALVNANARLDRLATGSIVHNDGFGALLLQAATSSNLRDVADLLRAGVWPRVTNDDGESALHIAAMNGHIDIARLLLEKDASLARRCDQIGNLPLHLAVASSHLPVIDALLGHLSKTSLNSTNNKGDTPLAVAVKSGRAAIVSRLLAKKGSLSYSTTDGWTLLHVAAAEGQLDVVNVLLTTALNIFAKTTAGLTPLALAKEEQHWDVVDALKAAEATENQRFLAAAKEGHSATVESLLKKGVSVTTKDMMGRSALHLAAASNQIAVVALLLTAGATVNQISANGQTALHVAAASKCAKVVEQLVGAGAKVTIQDADGATPLLLAARHGHAAMTDLLLTAFSSDTTAAAISACHAEAMDHGHKEVADLFVPHLQSCVEDIAQEAGLETPNASRNRDALLAVFRIVLGGTDMDGLNKALVQAVLEGHDDAVYCLLAIGADASTMRPEQRGRTLLALAIQRGHDAVAHVLCPHLYPAVAKARVDELAIGGCIYPSPSVAIDKGTYQGKAVVLKGPKYPNYIVPILRNEMVTMQTYMSPYLLPLLAVLDNGSHAPHMVAPNRRLYSPTMITEYMDQGHLFHYLRDKKYGGHVGLELSTIDVALVLAMALADLHRRNVVHRDVKSLNIFLSATHYIRLGDLGSARTLDVDSNMSSNVGTKYWMAPEVLRVPGREGQGRAYTTAADIYSFGVVLTELDTLSEPYSDLADRSGVEELVRTGRLRPKMSANCPLWLKNLADKCLAFNPKARPTAAAIVKELLLRRDGNDDAPSSTDEKSARMSSVLGLPTIAEGSTNGSKAA